MSLSSLVVSSASECSFIDSEPDTSPLDAIDSVDADEKLPMVAELLTILLIMEVGSVDNEEKLQLGIPPHIDRLLCMGCGTVTDVAFIFKPSVSPTCDQPVVA